METTTNYTTRQTLINENPFGAYHELVTTKELDEVYTENLNFLRRANTSKNSVLTTRDEMQISTMVLTQMNLGGLFTK